MTCIIDREKLLHWGQLGVDGSKHLKHDIMTWAGFSCHRIGHVGGVL
jgi:hypothetical protein